MGLYDRLTQRKKRGEMLDMKSVDSETLYDLWWKEECSDGMIAELYDVPKKKITNLRQKWDLKGPEILLKEFESHFGGTIPTVKQDDGRKGASRNTALLLRKIHELNDNELEELRLELSRRYEAFAAIKQEMEFFQALERAVRGFY